MPKWPNPQRSLIYIYSPKLVLALAFVTRTEWPKPQKVALHQSVPFNMTCDYSVLSLTDEIDLFGLNAKFLMTEFIISNNYTANECVNNQDCQCINTR